MKALLLVLLVTRPALASITVDAAPIEGVDNWVTVQQGETPAAGETVTVVHRPGIVGEQEIAIGITDARGRVRWSPERGGVSTIHAGSQQYTLTVQRATAPASILTILTLLIMLALGSIVYGFRKRTR